MTLNKDSEHATGLFSAEENYDPFRRMMSAGRKKPSVTLMLIKTMIENRIIITCFLLSFCTGLSAEKPDSLSRYMETAAANNPGVRSAFAAYQSALQKIPQAGAYQDPQLDIGYFLQPMELIDGRQTAEFRLMQMFPWFGVQKAARTEAHHMAQMNFELFRETRDQLFLDVYTQWYALCILQQKMVNAEENLSLLLQLEELAIRRFASPTGNPASTSSATSAISASTVQSANGGAMSGMGGSAEPATGQMQQAMPAGSTGNMSTMTGGASSGMSNVIRIKMEIAEAGNAMENLQSDMEAAMARFNSLLGRPATAAVHLPDTIAGIDIILDIPSALESIKQKNPMLAMLDEESEAFKAKAEMDKKMGLPMFGIGLQYMLISKTKPAEPSMEMSGEPAGSMNGKDMLMPMISVTIPIYRSKHKALQRENSLLRQANRDKYANTLNLLEAELYRLKSELDNAGRKITLYRKQTELAQSAASLARQELVSGKGELTAVIQAQRQLLDYKLRESEATATYNTMAAGVRKLLSDYADRL
ncbi:MAG: TolC family protein [Tannerellaceae bacterium]|jgi:outer membrane protein TolC|nr:TolC family protein [Tannerellaceae bacterium]